MQVTTEIIHEKPVDYTGSKMGMWIFLFTELLFFGGLFLLYAVYRSQYTQEFHTAADELDRVIGSINTIILISSSLTMALSVSAMKRADFQISRIFQLCTILLGVGFLVVKYFEWSAKIGHGIFPGSPEMIHLEQGRILFYSLYFVMTGLHGLHVLAGIFVLMLMLTLSTKHKIHERAFIKLENAGLYWHFVDIVWIYLFPLFYLIT
jgi:cytochrome c oxidase subunit 3